MLHLNLIDLYMQYGDFTALKGINIEIQKGEFIVVVGPSGCGKSSLLRAIAGLEKVSSGQIILGDKPIQNVPPAKRGLAMVFQNYALYPHMTVRQNMGFSLKLANAPKDEIEKRVGDAARILGLDPYLSLIHI